MTEPPNADDIDAPEDEKGSRAFRRHKWLWLIATIALAAGSYAIWHHRKVEAARAKTVTPPPIPVVTAAVEQGDIGVYLTGLGTVTPIANVTVRSLVDGQLMKVLFTEGQMVKRGDTLAQIDPRPFQAQLLLAQGQLQRDQALLENAQRDLARYQLLSTQDSIAKQQFDTQRAQVHQYEGTLGTDKAQIETARLNLTYARITSPVSGRVGLRLVDPGNIVHASDPGGLVAITQLQPIAVVFAIPQDNIGPVLEKLRAGEHPVVDAYNRELTQKIAAGRLLTADNQVDTATGTVKLKAIFENTNDELFPNQFVNAKLLLELKHNATLIPVAAVQRGPQKVYVYVVKLDKTVSFRDVKVGTSEGDRVAVESGVSPGETVVVDGADKLREGTQIVVRAEMGKGRGGGPP